MSNPPAFPGLLDTNASEGMSLRDWFAGQALAGLIPNAAWDYTSGPCNHSAAQRCYAIADAMLKERETKGNQP